MKILIAAALVATLSAWGDTNAFDVAETVRLANGLTEEQTVVAEQIVANVYGEDTNSSFIVRKELTATQRRFIALGHHYVRLAFAYVKLEERLRALEDEKKERDDRRAKVRRDADEKRDRDREKVRRAIERTQTAPAMKRNRPKKGDVK